jgi:hypothetical protein
MNINGASNVNIVCDTLYGGISTYGTSFFQLHVNNHAGTWMKDSLVFLQKNRYSANYIAISDAASCDISGTFSIYYIFQTDGRAYLHDVTNYIGVQNLQCLVKTGTYIFERVRSVADGAFVYHNIEILTDKKYADRYKGRVEIKDCYFEWMGGGGVFPMP